MWGEGKKARAMGKELLFIRAFFVRAKRKINNNILPRSLLSLSFLLLFSFSISSRHFFHSLFYLSLFLLHRASAKRK